MNVQEQRTYIEFDKKRELGLRYEVTPFMTENPDCVVIESRQPVMYFINAGPRFKLVDGVLIPASLGGDTQEQGRTLQVVDLADDPDLIWNADTQSLHLTKDAKGVVVSLIGPDKDLLATLRLDMPIKISSLNDGVRVEECTFVCIAGGLETVAFYSGEGA